MSHRTHELPAGHIFEAELNGHLERTFACEVTDGCAEEGHVFLDPLPSSDNEPRIKAPLGKWKRGGFDYFTDCICHAALCCSIWCQPCAMDQVMIRITRNWIGHPTSHVTAA